MLPTLNTIYFLLTDSFKPSKEGIHLLIHYMQKALDTSHREYIYIYIYIYISYQLKILFP